MWKLDRADIFGSAAESMKNSKWKTLFKLHFSHFFPHDCLPIMLVRYCMCVLVSSNGFLFFIASNFVLASARVALFSNFQLPFCNGFSPFYDIVIFENTHTHTKNDDVDVATLSERDQVAQKKKIKTHVRFAILQMKDKNSVVKKSAVCGLCEWREWEGKRRKQKLFT